MSHVLRRRAIDRRLVLRGAGVTFALPWLGAMVPARASAVQTKAPRRLGFVYLPNGVAAGNRLNLWRPTTAGADFVFNTAMKPLERLRDHVVVVSGLVHAQALPMGDGAGDHTRATACWLNGIHPRKAQGSDVRAGKTADQIAADVLGRDTVLPSLEVVTTDSDPLSSQCENGYSCAYLNTVSWRTATEPQPMENSPRVVFERLFGDGGTTEARAARLAGRRSVLDFISADLARVRRSLGGGDVVRVDEYLDTVRSVEQRIDRARASAEAGLPATLAAPSAAVPVRFDEHARLMFDLLWLAFQSDRTRVFSLMTGRDLTSRTYPEIGITEPHHPLSHHAENPEQIAKYAKVNAYFTEQLAYFLDRLRATPDGDGTLLDHSQILYGSAFGNPNSHSHFDLGAVVAGGGIRQGRHVAYPVESEVPMTNLLVTMLANAGVPVERLGDSTGRVEALAHGG